MKRLDNRRRRLVWFSAPIRSGPLLPALFLFVGLSGVLVAEKNSPRASADGVANVLFIITDDMNVSLGCYGHPVVESPHVDALAARGIRFQRAYCNAPVCNPTRASCFSGQRPETIDVLDNKSPWPQQLSGSRYMPDHFQRHGFFTASIGKVFDHGHVPDQPYWDVEIREWGKFPRAEQILKRGTFPTKPHRFWAQLRGPDAETADGDVVRRAVQLMQESVGAGRRFFLAVGLRRPHGPFAAPKRYFDLYQREDISLPDATPEHLQSMLPIAFNGEQIEQPQNQLSSLLAYYACISFVDAQVGVLTAALDRLDLWSQTAVIFVSDHGYHTGHHGMWHKRTLFEIGTRVPLIIAAPGKRPAICPRVVEMVDLYPTLTDLCKIPAPTSLHGRSLTPLLDAPRQPWPQPAFTSLARVDAQGNRTLIGRSVRTERFRYTEWDRGRAGVELYDHAADPDERTNLATHRDYAERARELQEILRSNKEP